jgi:hypothetical protein
MQSRLLPIGTLPILVAVSCAHDATPGLMATSPTQPSAMICGAVVSPPKVPPPDRSGPVVYMVAACFERQDGLSRLAPRAYRREIQLRASQPAAGKWVPYDSLAETVIQEDFRRLSNINPGEDLSIVVSNYAFANGVVGKLVTYNIKDRK